MPISDGLLQTDAQATRSSEPDRFGEESRKLLAQAFAADFTMLDGLTGEVLCSGADQPGVDWPLCSQLCGEVARRGRPELIDDEDPFLVLALPLAMPEGHSRVAVGTFATREVGPRENISQAARRMGMQVEEARLWANRQTPWSADALVRIAELVLNQWNSSRRIEQLQQEAASLSAHLAGSYEEISLLYRLTQNLKISESDERLDGMALEWMREVLPAAALAIQLVPVAREDESLDLAARKQPVLICCGDCPIDNREFTTLMEHLDPGAAQRPVVVNRQVTGRDDWPCQQFRQMIVVRFAEGDNLFGYLAALNHLLDHQFGTVYATLVGSVAAILGIHSGNIELYRQRSELLAGIVRALSSAIDAKDPYTCGHSDRVARVTVRLAEELGCDAETLNTLYLSGLLHDIGKIGIDDNVLRKPGKLSDEEYSHIKRHPEIGHKILRDLGKLPEVLPAVLHHHESWDGSGYPQELTTEKIPLAARIVGVADAFDAMSSDRPYRKGMPDEKIDAIFRAGSGQQWDPQVVEAFFRARDDVRQIAQTDQPGMAVGLHGDM